MEKVDGTPDEFILAFINEVNRQITELNFEGDLRDKVTELDNPELARKIKEERE